MLKILRKAFLRLRRDEGGNVFILFGACALPLLLVMGGAVDFARYTRYKAELSHAVDSAALALARQHSDYTEAQATTFVTNYVNSFSVGDTQFTVQNFDVDKITNGFRVAVNGTMTTLFLPLTRFTKTGAQPISGLTMNIVAEVVNSTSRLEVALVFDNTGSMNCGNSLSGCDVNDWQTPPSTSRIVALKSAAHTLVNILMPTGYDASLIKIGMVPFEGAVNIGSTYAANPPAWVDWSDQAKAKYNGRNFDNYNFGGSIGTQRVGHKWLFNQLTQANSSVTWAGCVEMRAEPYDIIDTVPSTGTPDTLFVPYFWPDEPDRYNPSDSASPFQYTSSSPDTRYNSNYATGSNATSTSSSYNYSYTNNYLKDKVAQAASASRPATVQRAVPKYKYTNGTNKAEWHSGQLAIATSFPYQSGPNYGCPKPIVPLTSTKSTVDTAIDGMIAYASSGTYIPTGLVWGWHVLSPTEPFTQGIGPSNEYYDQTVKALVLFTDGENFIIDTSSGSSANHNKSYFSGYNYVATAVGGTNRLGSTTSAATTALDTKTATLCENVKKNNTNNNPDDDIRLYTITFGSMSSADEDLMRNCATLDDGERLYYHAPTTTALQGIFQAIGEDLSQIHLSM